MKPAIGAILALGGLALLIGLGIWQVQRLHWKTALLADLEQRIAAAPTDLPADPDPDADRYRPVTVTGETTGEELHVLISTRELGAAYRVIAPFLTEAGPRVLVDLGAVATDDKAPRGGWALEITGNLHWPDETDRFTPAPDIDGNIWFARDVAAMAAALGTDPVLVVARETTPPIPGVTPLPLTTAGIPNNHLNYAITWFSLAAIWAGMTGWAAWRMARARGA